MPSLLSGRSQLTNQNPPVKIPDGFYDQGQGFFDPESHHVVDYKERKFVDTTGPDAQKWIRNTCRKGQISPPDQTHIIGLEICFESWSAIKNGS